MGRELKRVPLDFADQHPVGEAWPGYLSREKVEPPDGRGYQLWENTSEGSPISPVFEDLWELCEWAEINATTFGPYKATADQWYDMLSAGVVFHQEGEIIFI